MKEITNIHHMRIGLIVKGTREQKRLTQGELSSRIGCHQSTLAGYEAGTRPIPADRVNPLAKVLGIKPALIDHSMTGKSSAPEVSNHHLANQETYLYRLFNKEGELIYIGCTHDFEARMYSHKNHENRWWYPQVHSHTIEVFSNRPEAHTAERQAIHDENPKWNIRHRSLGYPHWTEQMYLDYIKALQKSKGSSATDYTRARIARAEELLSELRAEQLQAA